MRVGSSLVAWIRSSQWVEYVALGLDAYVSRQAGRFGEISMDDRGRMNRYKLTQFLSADMVC